MIVHIDSRASKLLDFIPRFIATRERVRVGTDCVNYERVIFPCVQRTQWLIKQFWRSC